MGESVSDEQLLCLWGSINADVGIVSLPNVVIPSCSVKCRLGRGKTSDVFMVAIGQGDVCLKVPREGYEGVINREIALMEKLMENDHISQSPHFSKLYPVSSVKVQWGKRTTTGFFTIPCGTERDDLMREDVLELAQALSLFHKLGYRHRDISPSNVSFDSDGNPFFRDFGFSTDNPEDPYQGAIGTASNRILRILAEKKEVTDFTDADDVESLLKTIFIILFRREPRVERSSPLAENAQAVLEFWEATRFPPEESIAKIVQSEGYVAIENLCWLRPRGVRYPSHS